jgi:hypothetical protein
VGKAVEKEKGQALEKKEEAQVVFFPVPVWNTTTP